MFLLSLGGALAQLPLSSYSVYCGVIGSPGGGYREDTAPRLLILFLPFYYLCCQHGNTRGG